MKQRCQAMHVECPRQCLLAFATTDEQSGHGVREEGGRHVRGAW